MFYSILITTSFAVITLLQNYSDGVSVTEVDVFQYKERRGQWICSGSNCHDVTDLSIRSFYYATRRACMKLSACGNNRWYCPGEGSKDCAVCDITINGTNSCPNDTNIYSTPDECQTKEHCHPRCGADQEWTRYRDCNPNDCDAYDTDPCDYGHDRADVSPGCVCDARRRKVMKNNKCILVDECPRGSSLKYNVKTLTKQIRFYCANSSDTECAFCNVGGFECPENVTLYNSSVQCTHDSECTADCGQNMHWSLDYPCENMKCEQYRAKNVTKECQGRDHHKHYGCACDRGYFLQRGTCVKLHECDREEKGALPTTVLYKIKGGSLSILKERERPKSCKDVHADCMKFPADERCLIHLDSCMATCGCCNSTLSATEDMKCFLEAADSEICLTDYAGMVDKGCGSACCRWLYLSFQGEGQGRPIPDWKKMVKELRQKIPFS